MRRFLRKMRGSGSPPACACYADIAWAWVGAFLGILLVAALNAVLVEGQDGLLLIGSAGASAVLLLAVALVVNNIPAGRSYPRYWW